LCGWLPDFVEWGGPLTTTSPCNRTS
jgi:hypothetical protein